MFRNHRLGSLVVLLVFGLLAAACGGGGEVIGADPGGTDAEPGVSPEAGAAEGEDAQPTETVVEMVMEPNPDDEGENIELTFWTFVDAHADFMIEQAEAFNAQSSDYNVLLNASVASFDEMHDRLLIALQSGVGAPDIVDIEIQRFATFLRGDPPLHPLTDLVDQHREELVEERLAPYQLEGVEYGIDYHLGSFVMYYNSEIMDEAGVDVDAIETWDDYIEAGQQVVEETGIMMTSVETQNRFSILGPMLQNGGGTYNEAGEMILDSPENVEAIEMVASMVHEHGIAEPPPGSEHNDPAYYQALNAGEYASVWYPQWYMIRFTDQMPDTEGKILVRPMPAFEPGGNVSTMGGGTGTAITNQIDEAKLQAAKDYLGFAKLTYDAQVKIWTDLGFDPFRDDVYEDEALQEPMPWFNNEPVLANLQQMFDRLAPEYTGPRYPEAIQQLSNVVAFDVIEQGADVQETLSAAAQEVRALDE